MAKTQYKRGRKSDKKLDQFDSYKDQRIDKEVNKIIRELEKQSERKKRKKMSKNLKKLSSLVSGYRCLSSNERPTFSGGKGISQSRIDRRLEMKLRRKKPKKV